MTGLITFSSLPLNTGYVTRKSWDKQHQQNDCKQLQKNIRSMFQRQENKEWLVVRRGGDDSISASMKDSD